MKLVALGHKVCIRDKLWVRFPLEKIKYDIFSFHRSSVRTKHSVELRYSTSLLARPSEFSGKLGSEQSALTQGSLCLPCSGRDIS